jgi:hypothetical protein
MHDTVRNSDFCRARADAARREAEGAVAHDIREQWLDLARHWEHLAHKAKPGGARAPDARHSVASAATTARKSPAHANAGTATLAQEATMEEEPTPEDAARHILRVFVAAFNRRPLDVLLVNNFAGTFASAPWRPVDFDRGLDHALRQGWIETNGPVLTLTDRGYAAT